MININQWFLNNYEATKQNKLKYNDLLKSSYLTNKNLEDFNNSKYKSYFTKLDIFKYITVLEYLFYNNEHCLAYSLNPYLIGKNNLNTLYPYNETLEVNMYKNIIIDLYFLDIPNILFDKGISLDILLGQTKDNMGDLKNIYKMGYGFDYFGKKSMSLLFMLYFKAFYKNITLYEYNDRYLNLGQLLIDYSINKIEELKENNTIINQETIYNYYTFLDNLENKNNVSDQLNLSAKIYLSILNDTSLVKPLHYECTGFVSPLDYQELSNSQFTDYCLLYNFDKSFNNEDMIDEGVEVYLKDLLESNINSKWFTSLILSHNSKLNKIIL